MKRTTIILLLLSLALLLTSCADLRTENEKLMDMSDEERSESLLKRMDAVLDGLSSLTMESTTLYMGKLAGVEVTAEKKDQQIMQGEESYSYSKTTLDLGVFGSVSNHVYEGYLQGYYFKGEEEYNINNEVTSSLKKTKMSTIDYKTWKKLSDGIDFDILGEPKSKHSEPVEGGWKIMLSGFDKSTVDRLDAGVSTIYNADENELCDIEISIVCTTEFAPAKIEVNYVFKNSEITSVSSSISFKNANSSSLEGVVDLERYELDENMAVKMLLDNLLNDSANLYDGRINYLTEEHLTPFNSENKKTYKYNGYFDIDQKDSFTFKFIKIHQNEKGDPHTKKTVVYKDGQVTTVNNLWDKSSTEEIINFSTAAARSYLQKLINVAKYKESEIVSIQFDQKEGVYTIEMKTASAKDILGENYTGDLKRIYKVKIADSQIDYIEITLNEFVVSHEGRTNHGEIVYKIIPTKISVKE